MSGTGSPGSLRQQTIAGAIELHGVGLHGGAPASLAIWPAPEDHGIRFVRRDAAGRIDERRIDAHWDQVETTFLATTLGNVSGCRIATVEHLMAALYALGVDNALVLVDGPEIPILDGSSLPFVDAIRAAGRVAQDADARVIRVLEPVTIRAGDAWLSIEPAETFSIRLEVDFGLRAVCQRGYGLEITPESFTTSLAAARTFGFVSDIRILRRHGLCLGGSFDNAVVLDDNGRVVNRGGLRFPDELVRHKILDCVGDLALAGARILGHVSGRKSGHGLNARLLRTLMSCEDAWEWSTPPDAWSPAWRLPQHPDIRPE